MNAETTFNFRIEIGETRVEKLCDAFFEGLIWRTSYPEMTSLVFDRRSNFLRWVRALHDGWGLKNSWPLYAHAYKSL